MKNVILLLSTILFLMSLPNAAAQKKGTEGLPKYGHIKDAWDMLLQAYAGKDNLNKVLSPDTRSRYIHNAEELLKDSTGFWEVVKDYPIVPFMFKHLLAGCSPSPDKSIVKEAQDNLQLATDEYCRLFNKDSTTVAVKEVTLKGYEEDFGLKIKRAITDRYSSQFCKDYGIDKNIQRCVKEEDVPLKPSIPEPTPAPPVSPFIIRSVSGMSYTIYPNDSTVVRNPDGQVIGTGSTPAKAIRRAMDRGQFKTPYFEALPVRLGRFGFLPNDKHGKFYELLFKGSMASDTLHFSAGKYFIPFDRTGRWKGYNDSMNDFAKLLYDYICEFDGSMEFVLIGSADIVPFMPKPFESPFTGDDYKRIRLTNYEYVDDGVRYYEEEIFVGDDFDNPELCDIRSVFIQKSLAGEPAFSECPPKVRIIKGEVTPNVEPLDRNVTILLFINWDAVNGKFRSSDPQRPYSPFKAKP